MLLLKAFAVSRIFHFCFRLNITDKHFRPTFVKSPAKMLAFIKNPCQVKKKQNESVSISFRLECLGNWRRLLKDAFPKILIDFVVAFQECVQSFAVQMFEESFNEIFQA